MKSNILAFDKFRRFATRRLTRVVALIACCLVLPNCGAFNASFLALVDPEGNNVGSTADLPPGFVVITFANNAEIDDQLLSYLKRRGLELTEKQEIELRPRVRLTVRITFADAAGTGNSFLDVEFVSGSRELVEPIFLAQSTPDLNQNNLDNVLVVCDIQSVALLPGSPIEVFVPVELRQLQRVEVSSEGGQIRTDFQVSALISPRFRTLQVDGVDAGGLEIQRNIGIEDLPSPIQNPRCGSVIGIRLDGTLSVPFHSSSPDVPSFDENDTAAIGTIGGRFEFRVTIG